MSRKLLSQQSEVSERYLANLEQGKGNISISLLRQVADALNAGIAELLPFSEKRTPEQALINDFISRLDRKDQRAALEVLYTHFSNLNSAKNRIALIGLRGAGKTTLGHLLEEREKLPFIRLSSKIETISGMPLAELMSLAGQQGYRRLEEKALFETMNEYHSCCIETGGSFVSESKAFNLLLTNCLVIWVKTEPDEYMNRVIQQGDMRPMMDIENAMSDLREILDERTPYYEQAHITIDTTGKTPKQSYEELQEKIALYRSASGSTG